MYADDITVYTSAFQNKADLCVDETLVAKWKKNWFVKFS